MNKSFNFLIFSLIFLFSYPCFANDSIQGRWVNSDSLKPGMHVITADNRVLIVMSGWQQTDNATTYNLTVENSHTYFVSKQSLWTHNMGECDEIPVLSGIEGILKRRQILNRELNTLSSRSDAQLITGAYLENFLPGADAYGARYVLSGGKQQVHIFRRFASNEAHVMKRFIRDQVKSLATSSKLDILIYRDVLRHPAAVEQQLATLVQELHGKGIQIGVQRAVNTAGDHIIRVGIQPIPAGHQAVRY